MIPNDIKKHRPKGTAISRIRNNYYVYEISSVYDKERKRSKRKTGACIGKITHDDGFIPNKKFLARSNTFKTKEFGASAFFLETNKDLISKLKKSFPNEYKRIFCIALLRVIDTTVFSKIGDEYNKSYLSNHFNDLALSKNTVGAFLDYLGNNEDSIKTFLKSILGNSEKLLFDGTSIFSNSENIDLNKKGYNNNGKSKSQINLLYAFSQSNGEPAYYRILPGNIVDKNAFKQTIVEMGLNKCIIIGDKGFHSKTNLKFLRDNKLKFIIPIAKNSKLYNGFTEPIDDKKSYDGVFIFHGRPIWYRKIKVAKEWVYFYLDPKKKEIKEAEYLSKIKDEHENYTMEKFMNKSIMFGVFAYVSNEDDSGENIYLTYKSRWEIEESFKNMKQNLELDTVNVSSSARLKGAIFLNHISLLIYYSLIKSLKNAKLYGRISPNEVISLLKHINLVIMNDDQSYISETTKKEKELILALGLNIDDFKVK